MGDEAIFVVVIVLEHRLKTRNTYIYRKNGGSNNTVNITELLITIIITMTTNNETAFTRDGQFPFLLNRYRPLFLFRLLYVWVYFRTLLESHQYSRDAKHWPPPCHGRVCWWCSSQGGSLLPANQQTPQVSLELLAGKWTSIDPHVILHSHFVALKKGLTLKFAFCHFEKGAYPETLHIFSILLWKLAFFLTI